LKLLFLVAVKVLYLNQNQSQHIVFEKTSFNIWYNGIFRI
jgi:hypothetical protein